jgi:hypothetical protein
MASIFNGNVPGRTPAARALRDRQDGEGPAPAFKLKFGRRRRLASFHDKRLQLEWQRAAAQYFELENVAQVLKDIRRAYFPH